MNISGISKGLILATLFNHAKPRGFGGLHHKEDHQMTVGEAEEILKHVIRFDYHEGRLLKFKFNPPGSENENDFDTRIFDHNYGEGQAEVLINAAVEAPPEKPVTKQAKSVKPV